jgi:hypothetical protein
MQESAQHTLITELAGAKLPAMAGQTATHTSTTARLLLVLPPHLQAGAVPAMQKQTLQLPFSETAPQPAAEPSAPHTGLCCFQAAR